MTRRSRIPAAEATPGARYKAKNGRVLIVYKKASKRWRNPRPTPDSIPYRAPAQPRARDPLKHVTTYGWLPPDYMLLPID